MQIRRQIALKIAAASDRAFASADAALRR